MTVDAVLSVGAVSGIHARRRHPAKTLGRARGIRWAKLIRLLNFSSPLFSIAVFYGFFVVGEYVYRAFGEPWTGDEEMIGTALIDNVVAFGVAALMAGASCWLFRHRRKTARPAPTPFFRRDRVLGLLWTSMAILVVIGLTKGVNPLSNPLLFRQAIQSGGNAYFMLFFLFAMKLYGVYFFEALRAKTYRPGDFLVALIVLAFSFASGFASLFAYFFIAGGVHLSACYGTRIVNAWTVVLGAVLVLVTPAYNTVRMLMFTGISVEVSDVVDTVNVLFADMGKVVYDRFDYFDNFVVGDAIARSHADPLQILSFLVQPIPRALYPEKAPNFSTLMTGWVYPGNIDMGVTANFGFVNEFILYFGAVGPICAGLFLGLLLFFSIKRHAAARDNTPVAVRYNLIVFPYVTSFVAGYINDFGLPTLIMNILFYALAVRLRAIRR